MLGETADALLRLAGQCNVETHADINGWSVDVWRLSSDSLALLHQVYRRLIDPGIPEEMRMALKADGIDVGSIFLDENTAIPKVTRADIVELAAAASMIAVEQIPVDTLIMPNVPKGSRRKSESGIDAMAAVFDPNGDPTKLADDEILYIGSAKHTVTDIRDLRYKLDKSVSSEELGVPYLAVQLRMYRGRLQQQAVIGDRVLLFLTDPLLDHRNKRIIAVGAVSNDSETEFLEQLEHLSSSDAGLRRFRCLLIEDLPNMHSMVVQ